MERSQGLTKLKTFHYKEHFNEQVNTLLKHLYPQAEVKKTHIKFVSGKFKGLSCLITQGSLYPNMSEEFKERFPRFKRNGYQSFEELVNTGVQWTGSSGSGYIYPLDRSKWDDSPLDMEQKAAFFVVVMQVCLTWMIKQND
ncbi:MAG TPA: hypothetical protein DCE27_16050 [Xanthomarina gelatinilytica]|nr:hypothetical protein [Xanthomarina gelatinilytica]